MDKVKLQKRIFRNIRYLRKQHNLSQKQMAQIMRLCVGGIRKIEKGDHSVRIHIGHIYRLCDHFSISADALVYTDFEQS